MSSEWLCKSGDDDEVADGVKKMKFRIHYRRRKTHRYEISMTHRVLQCLYRLLHQVMIDLMCLAPLLSYSFVCLDGGRAVGWWRQ